MPTKAVTELIGYALAVTAEQHGIQLHEFEFLSNHGHLLLTDARGVLPDFMRDLDSLISRSLNALRGHRGTNIEKGYNAVVPQDDEKVLEHAVSRSPMPAPPTWSALKALVPRVCARRVGPQNRESQGPRRLKIRWSPARLRGPPALARVVEG